MNIYPYPWPIGTCHYRDLPLNMQEEMARYIVDGAVSIELEPHMTATEGAYVNFAGWKVRVTIESTSPTTYIVRLA